MNQVLCNTCSNLKGSYIKSNWYGQEHQYTCKATGKAIYPHQEQSARLYMACSNHIQGEPDLKEIIEMEKLLRAELARMCFADLGKGQEGRLLINVIKYVREIKERG